MFGESDLWPDGRGGAVMDWPTNGDLVTRRSSGDIRQLLTRRDSQTELIGPSRTRDGFQSRFSASPPCEISLSKSLINAKC